MSNRQVGWSRGACWAFVLGLFLTAAGSVTAQDEGVDAELRRQAESSLTLGRWAFLAKTRVTVDTVWTLRKALEAQPDERLMAWADERAAELSGDKFARLLQPDAKRPILPEGQGTGMQQLGNYILAAVGAPADRAVRVIDEFTATAQRSYGLTHQVFVIKWAAETGLDLPSEVRQRVPGLLKKIAAELAVDRRFSDLYAERVALLLFFGDPSEQDAARWTRKIVDEQGEDGLWGSSHTNGFCVMALSLVLKRY